MVKRVYGHVKQLGMKVAVVAACRTVALLAAYA
jgi:hypothetical protein